MKQDIKIEVSGRHIHLTEETYNLLFDEKPNVVKKLSQKGEFASDKTVTLIANGYEIKNVRFLGPCRKYNQIEISHSDALKFKLNPPVRESGNLEGAETITVKTDKASIEIPGCIIAERHVHFSPEDALKQNICNRQKLLVEMPGIKKGIVEAYAKVSETGVYVFHIDTDDANAFLINDDNNKGTLII